MQKKQRNVSQLLRDVQPEDLLKFGMIPEFIGRLPVIAALEELHGIVLRLGHRPDRGDRVEDPLHADGIQRDDDRIGFRLPERGADLAAIINEAAIAATGASWMRKPGLRATKSRRASAR